MAATSSTTLYEHHAGRAAGDASWVRALSSGTATRRTCTSCTAPFKNRIRAPIPSPKCLPLRLAPPRFSRKPESAIHLETKCFQRDQYIRAQPLVDAAAQRLDEQLMFEHGRERVREMRKIALQQEAAKQQMLNASVVPATTTREQLIKQV